MTKITTISIITLTYKNWHLLDAAISSVNSQIVNPKYNVEYLIVDDGTEGFNQAFIDNELLICPFDSQVIVNEKNIGIVKSFNKAIMQSKGDIIIPLSADDEFYDPYVVSNIINAFETTGDLVITGLRAPISKKGELLSYPRKSDRKLFSNKEKLFHRMLRGNIISGASTYYHRTIFDKVGFFDEQYTLLEDFPFYLKVLSSGFNIGLLNKKTIKYGTEGINSSSQINPVLRNDVIKALKYTATFNDFSLFEYRYLSYKVLLDKKEKLKLLNVILYLDCLIVFVFRRFKNKVIS